MSVTSQPLSDYELRAPSSPDDWEAYHTIRRHVLWELRGRFGVYDPNHPDESAPGNQPFLFLFRGEPVAVVRIDQHGKHAQIRRMAVRADLQRRGHGTALLELATQSARTEGVEEFRVNVAQDAVEFYRKCGFKETSESPDTGSNSVSMGLSLLSS